jgi:hypothetical protein
MDPLVISLVSAATALVASLAGPFVTLHVARSQFNARVLSANRQKWIETLRDQIAELVSMFVAVLVLKQGWRGKWNKGLDALAADPALIEKLERIVLIQWKIRLLLNPAEMDHQALYERIEAAFERLRGEEMQEGATTEDLEEITRMSQAILKREWVRVKQGT